MDEKMYLMAISQQLATTNLICLAAVIIARRRCRERSCVAQEEMLRRQQVRQEMLQDLSNMGKCQQVRQVSTETKLPSSSKSKKRKIEEDDGSTSMIMESISNVADAIDRNTKVLESSRPRVYSEEEIYKELELMGMRSDDLSNAYLFLVERPEKARALFGCPLHMRMNILGKMMEARE